MGFVDLFDEDGYYKRPSYCNHCGSGIRCTLPDNVGNECSLAHYIDCVDYSIKSYILAERKRCGR